LHFFFFFFQAEDGIRVFHVTGVQTCALPILPNASSPMRASPDSFSNTRLYAPARGSAALDSTVINSPLLSGQFLFIQHAETPREGCFHSQRIVELDQPRAAAAWAATSAAKSSSFFSMPSPTTYRPNCCTLEPLDFSTCSADCLSSLTKGCDSKVTSFRNFWIVPSTILATISAGLPDSAAFCAATERSRSISSAATPLAFRAFGLVAATCMAMSLPRASSPLNSTSTPMRPPCT